MHMKKRYILLACISVLVYLLMVFGIIAFVFTMIKDYRNKKNEDDLPLKIEKHLQEKYDIDFIFCGTDVIDIPDHSCYGTMISGKNTKVFYFYPTNHKEYTIYAAHGKCWNEQIIPMPVYWYVDNMTEVIIKTAKYEKGLNNIRVSEANVSEAAEQIFELQSYTIELASDLNCLDWHDISSDFELEILYNDESKIISFKNHDYNYITAQLRMLFE